MGEVSESEWYPEMSDESSVEAEPIGPDPGLPLVSVRKALLDTTLALSEQVLGTGGGGTGLGSVDLTLLEMDIGAFAVAGTMQCAVSNTSSSSSVPVSC